MNTTSISFKHKILAILLLLIFVGGRGSVRISAQCYVSVHILKSQQTPKLTSGSYVYAEQTNVKSICFYNCYYFLHSGDPTPRIISPECAYNTNYNIELTQSERDCAIHSISLRGPPPNMA